VLNIEEYLIAALNKEGYRAYADVPSSRENVQEFVTVEMTGSSMQNQGVKRATIAVQSWAPTRYKASVLAGDVDAFLRAGLPSLSQVDLNSLYNYPDPLTNNPRYQGVYNVVWNY
jgi:hypothetical protein